MASLDALLATVYANPDDIAARLVYADALIEAGDPRGELIARQCNGDDANELLAAHRDKWLGPLAPIASSARFTSGFLASVHVSSLQRDALLAACGDPIWSTVTQIDFISCTRPAMIAILLAPTMRSLRRVSGMFGEALLALYAPDHSLPIRAIRGDLESVFRTTEQLHLRDEPRGLPELRRLEVDIGDASLAALGWVIGSRLAGQLDYLHVKLNRQIRDWSNVTNDAHPTLRELVVDCRAMTARFCRSADGSLHRVA